MTLGRSVGTTFWGSTMPITRPNLRKKAKKGDIPTIHVQTSMPGVASNPSIKSNLVAPLERASTLKVSRILEGSYPAPY